ncbi:MAG: CDP-alcohol phosphatidyltransferase family protein [Nitrospirae bacterium]|nr:CDP-alcohol phosphatidyltransferase family protein [Nitrospirota bacterium]MBF0521383.1 CDP-alcohol phosphatidyltransferase family protein [Nitrospirota bacterium]MBF0535246.1 CDP-alcohol phosphatidyltransferase family protein [Nitrospirota bacterium]MBF0615274.1 CDP-alcohol phosphatidyltransferase family protein [Nitrospirota bacterium]
MEKPNTAVLNVPNVLTMLRIVAIPFFAALLIYAQYRWALIIFVAASITDALDGLIARLTKKQTQLGKFLDPTADKFLLITSYVLFSFYGFIPTWLTICIISRDLIVVVGWGLLYMVRHVVFIMPSVYGKFAIAFQMVLLAYMLLKINFRGVFPDPKLLVIVTAVLTVVSGLHYLYKGFMYANE